VQDVSTSAALRNSPWAERLLKAGVRSFVAAPLMSSSERLLGIITVGFPRPGRPTETQIHFLDLLAREAADYLERKQIEKQLAHAHDQLADRAVHLEQLVKERTARLQEMIDDMDAFSYSLVHDMRAPLRAMQTFAEVLKEDCRNLGPIAQDYIHRIQVASQRIDHLIREGLYYSRFMREDMPLSPLNPKELLLGIVETYPQFAQCRQSISICGEFPMVRANEAALTQCFSQLLDNAVKFVTPGAAPAIVVWCEPARSRARIYFRDNGVGINAEGRAQIYKIFRKLDNEHRGTGIGLAIVKKAVERMGGTAGVVSDPQGSIFWLELGRAGTTQNPKPDVPQESLAEAI
jgi:signal transduction histidine kinase